ncbi:hypothetical protein RF11_15851 [Thelohanellus kitauei]|uniref:Uncharacterized protein n=1 Tax=Thelohanellus kitauei TaxID=669202 RepID=A0A0C2MJI2_THEKT|nr:hypothetical protein RF11_15851 [Thelohanellus kitauei]
MSDWLADLNFTVEFPEIEDIGTQNDEIYMESYLLEVEMKFKSAIEDIIQNELKSSRVEYCKFTLVNFICISKFNLLEFWISLKNKNEISGREIRTSSSHNIILSLRYQTFNCSLDTVDVSTGMKISKSIKKLLLNRTFTPNHHFLNLQITFILK